MTIRQRKKHRTWISVRQGRGSIEAMIVSPHAVACHDCHSEMWWAVRKDNPDKKFPAHREIKHEEGGTRVVWWNHTIFCPVAGVLAREHYQHKGDNIEDGLAYLAILGSLSEKK